MVYPEAFLMVLVLFFNFHSVCIAGITGKCHKGRNGVTGEEKGMQPLKRFFLFSCNSPAGSHLHETCFKMHLPMTNSGNGVPARWLTV